MNVSWATIKAQVDAKNLALQYIDVDNKYFLKAFDGPFELSCIIPKAETPGEEQAEFEEDYKDDANKPIVKRSASGRPLYTPAEQEGEFNSYPTFDLCDKTSWYMDSERHTAAAMTRVLVTSVFTSGHANWIDVKNGKVTGEDALVATYGPKVYANGVLQDASTYSVDYALGKITFTGGVPAGTITADFSKAQTSKWILGPAEGKILVIKKAEIQFSKNIVMSPINFEVWGYNPASPPNKMMYERVVYKNEKDILNISNGGISVPHFGALAQDVVVFPFNYVIPIRLRSAYGMEIRLQIANDVAFGGEFGTATLYTSTEDEE